MSKIQILAFVGVIVLLVIALNWIRKHDFIDIFTAVFIIASLFCLSLCGLYIYKEVSHG